ncbi:hypothetical protein C8Q78DRAFT_991710 [Trametes maxima]|nr:hypothetical protein C8Q78DRAFT_991710 [Trametes maxima]
MPSTCGYESLLSTGANGLESAFETPLYGRDDGLTELSASSSRSVSESGSASHSHRTPFPDGAEGGLWPDTCISNDYEGDSVGPLADFGSPQYSQNTSQYSQNTSQCSQNTSQYSQNTEILTSSQESSQMMVGFSQESDVQMIPMCSFNAVTSGTRTPMAAESVASPGHLAIGVESLMSQDSAFAGWPQTPGPSPALDGTHLQSCLGGIRDTQFQQIRALEELSRFIVEELAQIKQTLNELKLQVAAPRMYSCRRNSLPRIHTGGSFMGQRSLGPF